MQRCALYRPQLPGNKEKKRNATSFCPSLTCGHGVLEQAPGCQYGPAFLFSLAHHSHMTKEAEKEMVGNSSSSCKHIYQDTISSCMCSLEGHLDF